MPADIRQEYMLAQLDSFRRISGLAEGAAVRLSQSLTMKGALPAGDIPTVAELMGERWVSHDEVSNFVKKNPNYFSQGTAPKAAEESARRHLETMRLQSFYEEGREALRREKRLSMLTPIPCGPFTRLDLQDVAFSQGSDKAKIKMVHVTDFQCPQCKYSLGAIDAFVATHAEKVLVDEVFLPPSEESFSAYLLRAAFCLKEGGAASRWQSFRQAAFQLPSSFSSTSDPKNQPEMWKETIINLVDAEARPELRKCMSSDGAIDFVKQSREALKRAGISSAPAYFINGRQVMMNGIAQPAEVMAEIVADLTVDEQRTK